MFERKHLQEVSNKVREETQQSEEQEEQYPGLNVPIFTEEFMTYSRGTCICYITVNQLVDCYKSYLLIF